MSAVESKDKHNIKEIITNGAQEAIMLRYLVLYHTKHRFMKLTAKQGEMT